MSDLISREDAIDLLTSAVERCKGIYGDLGGAVSGAREFIKAMPSVEPEQKIGKWIEWQAPNGIDCGIECSECGYKPDAYPGYGSAYCPTCGAKMEWK